MVITTTMLMDELTHYSDPAGRILRMKKNGQLFPITRGLYETKRDVPGYCLAGAIYGPSYLSFDFALSYYGLIPEAVYTFTSATFDKRKIKIYENQFGRFWYRDVPSAAYPYGIKIKEEREYFYRIAIPEKALCDKLYAMPPVLSQRDIEHMLFEDLRIDRSEFAKLDKESILQVGEKYHCNNLKYLMKYLGRNF